MAPTASSANKVIYGLDNRFEVASTPYHYLNQSIAGMVKRYRLKETEDNFKATYYRDLTSYRGIKTCDDMQFRDQPTFASCTGFLIEEDILVTAGHCMTGYGTKVANTNTFPCKQNSWVFGYEKTSEVADDLIFGKDDVYNCETVIEARYDHIADYALIKLSKKTVNKTPVTISTDSSNYEPYNGIFVAGHPTGLPLKIAAGAEIAKNLNDNQFVSNLDSFAGNSGSPIFNSTGDVIGVLVSGETDYFYDKERACYTTNNCNSVGGKCDTMIGLAALGETGTKIHLVEKALNNYKESLKNQDN